jgi:deoxyxylulose-5-phosphate synthase
VKTLGIPDRFVAHGGRAELLREIDLDAQGIEVRVRSMVGATRATPRLDPVEGAVRESA